VKPDMYLWVTYIENNPKGGRRQAVSRLYDFDVVRTKEARISKITHCKSGVCVKFDSSETYQKCVDKWDKFIAECTYISQPFGDEYHECGLVWCPLTGTVHTCGYTNMNFYIIKVSINKRAVGARGYSRKCGYEWWSPKYLRKHITTPFKKMGMVKKYNEYKTPYEVYVRDRLGISYGNTTIKAIKRSARRKMKSVSSQEKLFFQMILSAKKLSDIYGKQPKV
jgi:hypothetical protein